MMKLCFLLPLFLGSLIAAISITHAEEKPGNEPSERVRSKLGKVVVEMLGRIERAEAFRVGKLLPEKAGTPETVGARVVEGESKALDKAFTARLVKALLSDDTYFQADSKGTKTGVGYRLWTESKECIEISCCVAKGNVWIVARDADGKIIKGQSRDLGGFRNDRSSSMRVLAAEAFPDDKAVQADKPPVKTP